MGVRFQTPPALVAAVLVVALTAACTDDSTIVPYEHVPHEGPMELNEGLRDLEISLEKVPREVSLGDVLSYRVVLMNPTPEDVPLDPCPVYFQSFGESSFATSRQSLLNCEDAPDSIDAGAELVFEMELPIDRATFPSSFEGSIFWRLGSPHGPISLDPPPETDDEISVADFPSATSQEIEVSL